MTADRIPCTNPRCRRTAPAAKCEPGTEIVCGKCWRTLPAALRQEYRDLCHRERTCLRRVERRVARGEMSRATVESLERAFARRHVETWCRISRVFTEPGEPVGLDAFLEEIGLAPEPAP